MTDDLIEVTLAVAAVLDRCGIPYSVGGSLASSLSGEPRASLDADVVVQIRPDQIDSLLDLLGDEFYADAEAIRRAIDTGRSTNLVHRPSGIKVDLFPAASFLDHQQLLRRQLVKVADPDRSLYVHSPEDILLQKLHSRGRHIGASMARRRVDCARPGKPARSPVPVDSGRKDRRQRPSAAGLPLGERSRGLTDAAGAAAAGQPTFALRASAFRQGYGGQVAKATAVKTAGRLLRIHVEGFNPALRRYERLGFRQIDDRGVYLFMERVNDNSQPPNDPTLRLARGCPELRRRATIQGKPFPNTG